MTLPLKAKAHKSTKRTVRVVPEIGLGTYEVDAADDEAAARYVVRNILTAWVKSGAVKEPIAAVCGKARVGV